MPPPTWESRRKHHLLSTPELVGVGVHFPSNVAKRLANGIEDVTAKWIPPILAADAYQHLIAEDSLWPVVTGFSKAHFTTRVVDRRVDVLNFADYAQHVEERRGSARQTLSEKIGGGRWEANSRLLTGQIEGKFNDLPAWKPKVF